MQNIWKKVEKSTKGRAGFGRNARAVAAVSTYTAKGSKISHLIFPASFDLLGKVDVLVCGNKVAIDRSGKTFSVIKPQKSARATRVVLSASIAKGLPDGVHDVAHEFDGDLIVFDLAPLRSMKPRLAAE